MTEPEESLWNTGESAAPTESSSELPFHYRPKRSGSESEIACQCCYKEKLSKELAIKILHDTWHRLLFNN